MKLYPAIDLLDGRAVRLLQGDYDRVTVYSDDPAALARGFYAAGARCLHVVDLDGARDGGTTNFDTVRRIIEATGMYCEVGGGVRSEERIEAYLSMGVGRVILGTAAVNDPDFLQRAVDRYGDRIAVGVDARDGFVAVNGWIETTAVRGVDFCKELKRRGVSAVIYTDIARDGALRGTNLDLYRTLTGPDFPDITASGGITTLLELSTLRDMGVSAAILGKALYEGRIDLTEAVQLLGGQE